MYMYIFPIIMFMYTLLFGYVSEHYLLVIYAVLMLCNDNLQIAKLH